MFSIFCLSNTSSIDAQQMKLQQCNPPHPTDTGICSEYSCSAGVLKANATGVSCPASGCDDATCCDAPGVQYGGDADIPCVSLCGLHTGGVCWSRALHLFHPVHQIGTHDGHEAVSLQPTPPHCHRELFNSHLRCRRSAGQCHRSRLPALWMR